MPTISVRNAASVAILAAVALMCWFAIGCGGDEERADNEQNVEATIEAVVSEISATRAAARPLATATPAPTDTPRANPTTIVVPTPTGASGAIRASQTNEAPMQDTLAPLPISDTESFLAGVSETERTCLSEAVSPDRLTVLLDSPESATGDERVALIGCLEHDTRLRLFLTPVLSATGPLSAESSACLRSSFVDTDVGALMLAATSEPGANADPEAAMATAMVSSMVSLGCLDEGEFRAAGPGMGVGPEEYENFQCVLSEVGGPERMAELMHTDVGVPAPLFEAAFACQAQVSGGPPG